MEDSDRKQPDFAGLKEEVTRRGIGRHRACFSILALFTSIMHARPATIIINTAIHCRSVFCDREAIGVTRELTGRQDCMRACGCGAAGGGGFIAAM